MLHIFTLTWNGFDKLSKLKNSITSNLSNIDYVWHIRDNNSSDNTSNLILEWKKDLNINIINHPNNKDNFSQGMNSIYEMASCSDNDLVLLLNNDVVFNDNSSIKNMMNIIKSPNVGVVGAKLLYTNTNKLQHAGVIIDDKWKMPFHFRSKEIADENSNKNREFQVVTGAVALLRSSDYKNICKNKSGRRGLDEDYHWAFDDVDMCLAVKYNLNKKIVYCGNTNIFHEESASLKKNPVNKLFMPHNSTHFKIKWYNRIHSDKYLYMNNSNYNLYTDK